VARRPLAAQLALGATGAAGVLLGAALFLTALAAKERDNRFCVSCHLHDEKFLRLTSSPPTDLAGVHQAKKADLGCIACHGGADPIMRAKVWTVAGIDTLRFLAGTYREPTQMRLPLRDAECRPCHTPILAGSASSNQGAPATSAKPTDAADESAVAEAATEGRGGTSYHAIREHQMVPIACVRCHTAHTTDADADKFLSRPRITAICRDCHPQM
jgi:predicted CXXCH cytochrome family protein